MLRGPNMRDGAELPRLFKHDFRKAIRLVHA